MKNSALVLGVLVILLSVVIAAIKLNLLPRPAIDIRNDNGRFVMHQNSQFRSDLFMIDTRTGRVWQYATVADDAEHKEQFWPIPYHVGPGSSSLRAPVGRSTTEGSNTSETVTIEEFAGETSKPSAAKKSK